MSAAKDTGLLAVGTQLVVFPEGGADGVVDGADGVDDGPGAGTVDGCGVSVPW